MAVLIAKAAGGVWTTAGTWELESGETSPAAPTLSDDCKLKSTSGSVTVSSSAKCRSLDCTGYTKTLKVERALALGTSTSNGSLYLKLVEAMTLEVTELGSFSFVSTVTTTEQEITCAGKDLQSVSFGTLGKFKLADTFRAGTSLAFKRGTLNFNNQAVHLRQFVREGSLTPAEVLMTSSAVTTETWVIEGSGAVIKSETSTLEVTGFSLQDVGGTAYNVLTLAPTLVAGVTTVGASISAATVNLNPAPPAKIVIEEGVTLTCTGTVSTNGKAGALALIEGKGTGKPGKMKKTTGSVSLDFIELKDITAEGGATFQAGLNSVNLGGNTGWKFAVSVVLASASSASAASAGVRSTPKVAPATAAGTSAASATAHAPTQPVLAAAKSASAASASTTAAPRLALAASSALSAASLHLTTGGTFLPLAPAASSSSATAAVRAAPHLQLAASLSTSSSVLEARATALLGLGAAQSTSKADATVRHQVSIVLAAAASASAAEANVKTPRFIALAPAASASSASAALSAPTHLTLQPALGESATTASITVRRPLALDSAASISAASMRLSTSRRLPLSPAVSTSSAQLHTYIRVFGRAKTKLGVAYGAVTTLEPAGG